MTVHIFGATSSPSCAQLCWQEPVEDQPAMDDRTKSITMNNFYMDDCLFSVPTIEEVVFYAQEVFTVLSNRVFNLTKWLSNTPEVLKRLHQQKLAKSILSLSHSDQICERVLGLEWEVRNDKFKFQVNVKNKPPTQRGMLSILSSVFDPLGFAAPVILEAKLLLQELSH